MRKKGTVHWLIQTVDGKQKRGMLYLLIIQILTGISGAFNALFLRDIINAAVSSQKKIFWKTVSYYALLVGFQLVLAALRRYLEEYTRSSLENCFKRKLFHEILMKPYAFVTETHSGEWMNRLTNDTVVVANGMTEILPGMAGMAVKIISAIIMISILTPVFMYVLIPGAVLLLIFSTLFRKNMKKLHKNIQECDGNLRVFLQEMLSSMLIIRSYAVETETESSAGKKMKLHQKARMKRNFFSNICNIGFGILMNGAYVLSAVICGYGIINHTVNYGTFVAVFQLVSQVQSPFANISGYIPKFYAMLASAERLMEIEKAEGQESFEIKSLKKIKECYKHDFEGLEMENICFSYNPLKNENKMGIENIPVVLSDISFRIDKKEYIAVTGISGCGKSTILKLLMCLYSQDKGQRYILLNRGKEILDISWQRLFAYVPQGNYLMSGTIREVITFSDKNRMGDEGKIWEALRIACADKFVETIGLEAQLGERGSGLSEGQMQRIAIARAIFSERPVLILDECTSALDEDTERQVLYNLRNVTDKTVLIVTHRPAALEICDKLLVFTEDGLRVRKGRIHDTE